MAEQRALTVVPSNEEVQASMAIAKAFVEAGYWQDVKTVAQAFVKVQAGREWGIPPFSAMSAVHIIQGKPTMAANAIAAKIKASGKYNFLVRELTTQACALEFFEAGVAVGVERFTIEDAKAAGLTGNPTWAKYPKNMLFARAVSNGARFYCSEVFHGSVVYTPEEMGAAVNPETGEVVSVPAESVRVVEPERPAVVVPPPASPHNTVEQPECMSCHKPITGHKHGNTFFRPADIAERTRERFAMTLCWDCAERLASATTPDEGHGPEPDPTPAIVQEQAF